LIYFVQVVKINLQQKLSEMSPGKSRKCPNCGAIIKFTGDDLSKVQKSFDNLKDQIKNLNKNLNIKL